MCRLSLADAASPSMIRTAAIEVITLLAPASRRGSSMSSAMSGRSPIGSRSMDDAIADDLWLHAFDHIKATEPETLAWARSVSPASFRNLRLKRFLSLCSFVVYASGFKLMTIDARFPAISMAFEEFEPDRLVRMGSLGPVLNVSGNERKAECFLRGAKLVIKEGFVAFEKRLRKDGAEVLAALPGLGPITKDHLAKDTGFLDVANGDV